MGSWFVSVFFLGLLACMIRNAIFSLLSASSASAKPATSQRTASTTSEGREPRKQSTGTKTQLSRTSTEEPVRLDLDSAKSWYSRTVQKSGTKESDEAIELGTWSVAPCGASR